MIREITDIQPYIAFTEKFTGDSCFSDPNLVGDGGVLNFADKSDKRCFGVFRDDELTGLFVFLILPEEKYMELLNGLSEEAGAYDELFLYLEENYPALYYAATYGKRYNVGPYTEGWYIPTSTEAGFQYRLPCRTWEQMEKIKASFQLFNDTWPFEFWVSNSVWRENSYDPYYGMYFWKEVPKDTKFALNSISPWCDCGAYPYYNSSKYPVIVMRKFY